MGYTKLFNSIITSTIWREDKDTKIVWVTMLAMANAAGQVEGTIPGLAAMANLTIPETEAALKKLMSPDPYSRTKDKEGRRVEEIDGGWLLINHAKYREKINTFGKEYYAIKQREHREKERTKEKESTTTNTTTTTEVKKCQSDFDSDGFSSFWKAYPKKVGKGKCEEWWKKNHPKADLLAKMLAAIEAQSKWEQWQKADGQFIPMPATWLNQGRWEDEGVKQIDTAKIERDRKNKEIEDSVNKFFEEKGND